MKTKQTAKSEADIREEFEAAYKHKIKDMYGMFELKYQSLHDSILSVFERIKKDEILSTMLNDRTSSIHLQDRVKQIFSEVVAEQRELIFNKMGTQIINLKSENEKLSRQLKKIKQSADHLQKDFYTQRLGFQETKNNVNQQLRKARQQIYNMQMDLKNKEREIQNMSHKAEELTQQNYQLKQLLNNIKQNKDEMAMQNQELNFYKSQIKGLQNEVQQLKTMLTENQQNFDRKYQNKKREFKQKIQEYKTVINQMRMDRNKTETTLKHNQEEMAQNNFQKKLSLLVRQHQKKLSEIKSSKDKQKAEIQRKYEYRIKQMQCYFQKMLSNKINEIEENTTNYFQKMREEGMNMEKQIMIYQENYVPLPQFEDQIAKRQEIIMMMKKKLEEFEANNNCLSKNQQIILNKLREAESNQTENKHKIYQLEEFNQQVTNKLKSYEQTNNIMKINDRKVKQQFEQYQRMVKKTKQENDDLKRSIIQFQENKNNLENQLREKQRKIKDDTQELELKNKKIKKEAELLENMAKEKDNLLSICNQVKKEMANLQYKLKDQEMTTNLLKNSLESKISNAQLQLKDKVTMMKQLESKYQEICQTYQQQKKKNYQIENLLKKYQMESKFYKQSGQMHKNELSSSIQQLKRIIIERNDKIEKLQIQIESKDKKIRTIQSDNLSNKERIYAQNKYLKSKLQHISKILSNKLQGLRKQCRSVKQYISSREIIMKNDESVVMSTFYKELIHMQLHNEKEKENVAKKVKQELSYTQSNQIKLIKNQFEDKIKVFTEKNEYQKALLKQEVKQKQEKIDQINNQMKKYQIQIKKQKQQFKNIERQYQILNLKFQKEKQHYQQKYNLLSKEMKEQKQLIIKEYNDKKYQMEHQITGLVNSIKRLKNQIELIQTKHQEEKLTVASQLKTIKEQEEAVARITSQKDTEIQKYQKEYQSLLQIKRNLQSQTRGYAQTLNKKIQLIHQLQLKENQITGEFNLAKTKLDRVLEENSQLKRKMGQKEEQFQQSMKIKMRMEAELKDIKGALNRSTKNNQLRALNQLSMQTLQLSQKVNEMRKVNNFLQSKTPLRS